MSYCNLRKWHKISAGIAGLFCLIICTQPFASDKTRLSKIKHDIQFIQKDLKKATNKKAHLQDSLKKVELAESQLKKQLQHTHKKLIIQRKAIAKLAKKTKKINHHIVENQSQLKKQIQSAYILSQQSLAKFLLDTNSIQAYQRTLVYFRYLTKAQSHIIENLKTKVEQFHRSQIAKQAAMHALINTQNKQLKSQKTLKTTKDTRHQLIKRINKHIKTKQQKLHQLIQDQKRLEKTLRSLYSQNENSRLSNSTFAQQKGHLSWPAKGRLQRHFGTQINQSELRWSGVLIEAPSGEPVHAIASGKVIFAKWLQGYGLLIIVDHGKGYMTLYGRNQTLLKKVGDWVTPNATIATVGHSGGFANNGLYFAIRYNAKPLNPSKWCRKRA